MIPCIVCGAELEPAIPEANNYQPYGGLMFVSHRVDHHWDYEPWVPFKEDNP